MRVFTTAIIISALGLTATSAIAETLTRTVRAGTTARLDQYMHWSNDCRDKGAISSGFSQRPAHGSVRASVVRSRIPGAADIGNSGGCAGKPIKALQVSYTAKKGYRGTDRLSVWVSFAGTGRKTYTYIINVQ
jgi:hypothetical protein